MESSKKNPLEQFKDAGLILFFGIPLLVILSLAKIFQINLWMATCWVLGAGLTLALLISLYFFKKKRRKSLEDKGPKMRLGMWARKSWFDASKYFELGLHSFRHILITGVTGCGKSTLIRRMISELNHLKRGYLYIDFKGEERELQEIIESVRAENRENEFQIFDLSRPEVCATRNLLTIFSNVEETVGFVMEVFKFEHEFYKAQAEQFVRNGLYLFDSVRELRSFENLMRLITNEDYRQSLLQAVDVSLHTHEFFQFFIHVFNKLDSRTREERYAGLVSKLSPLLSGPIKAVLNAKESTFDIAKLFESNRPTVIRIPGEAYGDLSKNIVQAFLSALPVLLARRRSDINPKDYFIFMDEQCSYTSDVIVDLLKKAGSARIHCVLTRQCDGDFDSHGDGFLSKVISACSTQFIFRIGDAETRDSIAKNIGTDISTKTTRRVSQGSETGEESAREVHEFKVSPDELADLPTGECIVSVRSGKNSFHRRIKVIPADYSQGDALL